MKETRWHYVPLEMYFKQGFLSPLNALGMGVCWGDDTSAWPKASLQGDLAVSHPNSPEGNHRPPQSWQQWWLHGLHSFPHCKPLCKHAGEGAWLHSRGCGWAVEATAWCSGAAAHAWVSAPCLDSLKSRFLACFLCPSHLWDPEKSSLSKGTKPELELSPIFTEEYLYAKEGSEKSHLSTCVVSFWKI